MKRATTEAARDARREVILQAALNEFFESGFHAARMDDIARSAKLSKGAVYLYFDTKEALFNAIISSIAVPTVDRIEAVSQNAPSAVEAIHALCAMAPQMIRQSPLPKVIKILIGDGNRFPNVVARYRSEVAERALVALTDLLERSKASGEIAVAQPALMARLFVAPVLLSAIWQILFAMDDDAEAVDLDALFELHRDNLLKALGLNCSGAQS